MTADTTMESLPHPSPNIVIVEVVSPTLVTEVEVRMDANMAKVMFTKIDNSLFPNATKRVITEA